MYTYVYICTHTHICIYVYTNIYRHIYILSILVYYMTNPYVWNMNPIFGIPARQGRHERTGKRLRAREGNTQRSRDN